MKKLYLSFSLIALTLLAAIASPHALAQPPQINPTAGGDSIVVTCGRTKFLVRKLTPDRLAYLHAYGRKTTWREVAIRKPGEYADLQQLTRLRSVGTASRAQWPIIDDPSVCDDVNVIVLDFGGGPIFVYIGCDMEAQAVS